jgi:LPS-assembly protein
MPFLLLKPLRPSIRDLHSLSVLVLATGLVMPHAANAQALMCPAYGGNSIASSTVARQPISLVETAKMPVNLQADSWEATVNGAITLTGNVQATQGERSMSADTLRYNQSTQEILASGTVQYSDSTLEVSGSGANMSSTGSAQIGKASFILKSSAGRGTAENIKLSPDGQLALDSVRYTTCPPGSTGWELRLSDLDINQQTSTGTGRNVRLEFQGIPIFYTPWISFPVGNQRKSGFLFPSFGGSSRGGSALSVPWYWNIAANIDDTITPTFDTARGFKLDNEFRYLGRSSKGTLMTGYLPHDSNTGSWRGLAQLNYRNDFTEVLRLDIDAAEVRDTRWFEDFGQTRDSTSLVYLNRLASISAHSDNWHAELNFQNLQVIDTTTPLSNRPYTRLPQFTLLGHEALPFGVDFNLDGELSYFTRGETDNVTQTKSVTGGRLYLNPELSMPLRSRGMYVTPSASWHYSRYQLQNVAADAQRSPELSAPTYALDTGMVFERLGGSRQQRLYTLEPRLLYSYVPYRAQTDIPLFDTGMPDFNLVQLFRTNRFIGPDRLGDTHQLSAGVTTRMLDAADGRQFLSGTIGQAYYFKTPCVTSLVQTTCANALASDRSSDLIGQLSLSAYKNWTLNLGMQWDPGQGHSERGDLFLQYHPAGNRTVNLGYNYQRDSVDQWVSSFAWPLSSTWSGYGRVVYSHLDRKFLDHFAGLEYRSCCWNIRAVVGRAVTTRTGEFDTQYKLQLELKGLSSVGTADTFLEGTIPGYSARQQGWIASP